jgi:excisionase family DNA binding protein
LNATSPINRKTVDYIFVFALQTRYGGIVEDNWPMTVTQTSRIPMTTATLRVPVRAGGTHRSRDAGSTTMLTVPEVAAACQISQSSVRRAIADGELLAVKLRSRVRIPREAFDAWLSQHQRPPSGTRQPPAPPGPAARRKRPRRDFPPGSFREMARFGADRTPDR